VKVCAAVLHATRTLFGSSPCLLPGQQS
jgi:hypothetical protein